MNRLILILLFLYTFDIYSAAKDDLILLVDTGLISEFKVTNFQDISLPETNYNIDCDDDGIFEGIAVSTGEFICDYSSKGKGVYTVRIQDNSDNKTGFSAPIFGNQNIESLTVRQWGSFYYYRLMRTFNGINFSIDTIDPPNFSRLISTQSAFSQAIGSIETAWDMKMSHVINMGYMFDSSDILIDTSLWNTTAVEQMNHVFQSAVSIPDISDWDVSSVINMHSLFKNTHAKIPNLSNWNVSSVQSMTSMFEGALFAVPETSSWNVSSVRYFENMFRNTVMANPDVSNWDVSSSISFYGMFRETDLANPDVSQWNMSNALEIGDMFQRSQNADPDVSNWDVSNVENLKGVFSYTKAANPDVSKWQLINAVDISSMFAYAEVAMPNVAKWDVSNIRFMYGTFRNSSANPDVSGWDVSSVVDMRYLFSHAHNANPDIGSWNLMSNPYLLNMFNNSDINSGNYDKALNAFYSTHGGVNVNLGNVPAHYCRSETERNELINDRGWLIDDLGKDCTEALNDCIFNNSFDGSFTLLKCGIAMDSYLKQNP